MTKKIITVFFEPCFWLCAMAALGLSDPYYAAVKTHFILCPLRLAGFNWCPGCGLGRSIAFLLRGNIPASIHAHWLGLPALVMIITHNTLLLRKRYVALMQAVNPGCAAMQN